MLLRPQKKALFLHAWMYIVTYAFFCVLFVLTFLRSTGKSPVLMMVTLFAWGAPVVLIRSYLANRASSCEIKPKSVIVTHGMFRWRRELGFTDLETVTAYRSTLFGGDMWYSYFYLKSRKRSKHYAASIIGLSESDTSILVHHLSKRGVRVDTGSATTS